VLVRKLVAHFVALPEVELHLVGHVIEPNMPVEDDLRVCRQLADEFPGCIVAPHFERPSEAKSYIASLDFFTGARMHACIAAFSAGVPVVPMAYSRKFNGLFGSLGYEAIADMKCIDTVAATLKVTDGFSASEKLRDELQSALGCVEQKLLGYESVLSLCLDAH
jgi:colanic acid/amylovoran biosynthesis protein